MPMRAYVAEQSAALLRRLVFRAKRVEKLPDADAVHDLRVAIRRFTQCLRVFAQFFPGAEAKKIRRRLQKVLRLAAEVRDRDIALALWKEAGLPSAGVAARLARERKQAGERLVEGLRRLEERNFSRKWRRRLGL